MTIDEALQQAVGDHQAGRLAEAEAIYRQVLAVAPGHARALHMLGVLAGQLGRTEEAVALIGRAIAHDPSDATFHNNLGKFLSDMGRQEEAIAEFDRAIALKGDYAGAHYNRGFAWQRKGELDHAIASYDEAIRWNPKHSAAHNNRGNALKDLGKREEAIAAYRTAAQAMQENADAYYNLGNAVFERGGPEDLAEAETCFREAMRLKPTADGYNSLGAVLNRLGRQDEAIACCQEALRLNPALADAQCNLALLLCGQGRMDEALAACREALRLKPEFAVAYCNLGMVQKDRGEMTEALEAFRRAMALQPDLITAHSNLIFMLDFHEGTDLPLVRAELQRWNARHAAPLRKWMRPHTNDRAPDRPLRIGYISPNFRDHCQAFYTVPLFSHHDRSAFHVTCYCDVLRPDGFTARLQGYAGQWRTTLGMSDERVAELIREDRIDILVDLTMHMGENRLLVFARQPAPVQVSWLAYPGTTGLEAIDYHLTDPYIEPAEAEPVFAQRPEEAIRLPDSFWCYDPLAQGPAVNAPPALASGVITFGSLNSFSKINETVLKLWAQVLREVAGSRLLMLSPEGMHRAGVLQLLAREGISPERIHFVATMPRADYLAQYQQIDIALDPVPSNGHTTSLDALWMGVPVVTLVGKTFVGRAGLCQLMNLGLPELIARTSEEYVRIAVELAGDMPRLSWLRGSLRERMRASPLMDAPRFARNMEAAFRQMWKRWCRTNAEGQDGSEP